MKVFRAADGISELGITVRENHTEFETRNVLRYYLYQHIFMPGTVLDDLVMTI